MLEKQFPTVAALLREAKSDLTAFADFPHAYWRMIWSASPLKRLNREVKRRPDVGIFPRRSMTTSAVVQLVACDCARW